MHAHGAMLPLSGERMRPPRVLAMAPSPSRSLFLSRHRGEAPQWAREARALPRLNHSLSDSGLVISEPLPRDASTEIAPLALKHT